MELVEIKVVDFYDHPVYYPFMTEDIYNKLEKAYIVDNETVLVPSRDFNLMMAMAYMQFSN